MWAIVIKLALGGWNILKVIGGGIASAARALNVQGWIGLGVALLLGFLLIQQKGETRHWMKQSNQFEKLYHNEQAAFAKTVANYRAAAVAARKADAANAARVVAEQKTINERTSHDYQARIADARATADRLRRQFSAAAADSSGGRTAPVSGVSTPAGGPAQAACDRLPDGSIVDAKLCATEQGIQLDELIKWAERQAGVDVNGEKRPPGPAPH
jgi:hypothetical protein